MSEQQTPPEGRRPITLEGRIGIGLALLALLGAGAMNIAPQQAWIGWLLIVVAVIGFVLLGIYHVSSTVAPPKATPRQGPSMTASDASYVVAVAAAAVAVLALLRRFQAVPIIAAIIACMAVGFDWSDRYWWSQNGSEEEPITDQNARVDVVRWQPVIKDKNDQTSAPNSPGPDSGKLFFLNIFLGNNGKGTISQWTFDGSVATGGLDKDLTDALFSVLKTKIKVQLFTEQEIHPGANDMFISMPFKQPYVLLDDASLQAYKNGALAIYTFLLMRYKDNVVPVGKYIYSERCVFLLQDVIHNCDGHNHNFISN